MATFTADRAGGGVQDRFNHEGLVHELAAYSASATLVAGDVIEMIKVPRGATIYDLWMSSDSPNAGSGDSVFSVGDAGDAARFLSSGIGSSRNIVRANFMDGYQYSADDTIDITYVTIPTDNDTASMVLMISVVYSCDIESNKALAGG